MKYTNYGQSKTLTLSELLTLMQLAEKLATPYTDLFNSVKQESKMSQNKQELALAQVSRRKFFVGSIDWQGNFSISVNPAEHATLSSAETERDRLAKASPGKAYFVAHFMSAAIATGIKTY